MGANFHTAHSSKIKGFGSVIGSCYADYWNPFDKTTNDASKSWDKAQKFATSTWVDDTTNLKNAPVYIISGGKDTIVPPIKQESVRDYYQLAGANPILNLIDNLWHGFPSIFFPDWNGTYKGFDGVGNILKHLLENLQVNSESVTLLNSGDVDNYKDAGVLRWFSQTEFSEEWVGLSEDLDYRGYVWIPNNCLNK